MKTAMSLKERYRDDGIWTGQRIGAILGEAALVWGDREFVWIGGSRYGFRALNDWATVVAQDLVKSGVNPGNRVIMQMINCVELIVAQFAVWRIGAVGVPIIPIYRAHEMRSILADAKPTAVIASHSAGSRQPYRELAAILDGHTSGVLAKIVAGSNRVVEGWTTFPNAPQGGVSDAGLPPPAEPEDCCTILYTSGTTSHPKGAMANSLCLIGATVGWRRVLKLSPDTVTFSGAPLTHIGALYSALLAPLMMGARTVLMSHWDPDRAIDLIEQERATYMAGATVFLHDLVERYEAGAGSGHRLNMFISGGAFTSPALIEQAGRVGIVASRTYGMTETCGSITLSGPDEPLDQRSLCEGRVVAGTTLEIVDDDRQPLPFGEVGQIRIRSAQTIMGYTDPALDLAQFDQEGWFYPEDIGHLTPDGRLTMIGRTKDIINRGGEKFSAQDIESALMTSPHVKIASVIGLPDARFGECVCACVVAKEALTWPGMQAVLEHLEAIGLARAKYPVEWLMLNELPRTASGKVQKAALIERAMRARSEAATVAPNETATVRR